MKICRKKKSFLGNARSDETTSGAKTDAGKSEYATPTADERFQQVRLPLQEEILDE